MAEPVSVALKFGFLAVLYLFLLWISRSSLKDLRGSPSAARADGRLGDSFASDGEATGLYGAAAAVGAEPRLVVERAPGHEPGMEYDLSGGALLGRGDRAEIRLLDPFASSLHARISRQGAVTVIEDLGSTNGTYLNEELLAGPAPLHPGDRLRIGDSEFTYYDR
ncbi:MAG TPA: FHA domain-containing protein [Solirubrobacteraceae bacterium]|jgi:hypothetical protein|nr:FHA domain-containing protein [Solirubrobacteraceae bacterium]